MDVPKVKWIFVVGGHGVVVVGEEDVERVGSGRGRVGIRNLPLNLLEGSTRPHL